MNLERVLRFCNMSEMSACWRTPRARVLRRLRCRNRRRDLSREVFCVALNALLHAHVGALCTVMRGARTGSSLKGNAPRTRSVKRASPRRAPSTARPARTRATK